MKNGDFIRLDYIGRLESGEIFDLTNEETAKKEKLYNEKIKYKPMPLIVGVGFVIPGLDAALLGMKIGEKKGVDIKPEDGFGQRDQKLIRVVPKKVFEGKIDPKPGMVVDFSGAKGRIQSVTAGRISIDFNNPLAGKTLKYDLEIKEEIKDSSEKVMVILEFFGAEAAKISLEEKEVNIRIKLPEGLKERIGSLIMQYITGMEKVNFIETYTKKEE
jgi:FKBP-type peptidyl-prolyl cis-trans isomerase 2